MGAAWSHGRGVTSKSLNESNEEQRIENMHRTRYVEMFLATKDAKTGPGMTNCKPWSARQQISHA